MNQQSFCHIVERATQRQLRANYLTIALFMVGLCGLSFFGGRVVEYHSYIGAMDGEIQKRIVEACTQ